MALGHLLGRESQHVVGDEIDDAALLGVVERVGHLCEQRLAVGDEVGRRVAFALLMSTRNITRAHVVQDRMTAAIATYGS